MAVDMTRCDPDADLLRVLEELRQLEPIFHTRDFGLTPDDFERRMTAGYWEVGASGNIYRRDFILKHLEKFPPVEAGAEGWMCWNHELQRLGTETYLITYNLRQGPRLTRRATLWRSTPEGWVIVYHQGTLVPVDEGDVAPPKS
jgi:hypothetical protein